MTVHDTTIEVECPVRVVYDQWTQFEQFPQFMEGVERVEQLDDTHLHWTAQIAGQRREWDAEIIEQIPDRTIAWESLDGVRNAGRVSFEPLTAERTLVKLELDLEPEGTIEQVGDKLGFVGRRVAGDLEHFREFVEARGRETGAWRGTVLDGEVASSPGHTAATGALPPPASSLPPPASSPPSPATAATQVDRLLREP